MVTRKEPQPPPTRRKPPPWWRVWLLAVALLAVASMAYLVSGWIH